MNGIRVKGLYALRIFCPITVFKFLRPNNLGLFVNPSASVASQCQLTVSFALPQYLTQIYVPYTGDIEVAFVLG